MKPFRACKYFWENKRKGVMTVVVLMLTVCAISLITVLMNSIFETANDAQLKPLSRLSLIYKLPGDLYLNNSVSHTLKTDSNVKRLIACDVDYTSFNTAFGNIGIPVVFAKQSDLRYYMKQMQDTLKSGRLPKNKTNEIAVHWRVLANRKWKLGEKIGSNKDSTEQLSGTYKIVGVLDGPNIAVVGTRSYREKQYIKNGIGTKKPIAYAVFPKHGKNKQVDHTISQIKKTKATFDTYSQVKKIFDKQIKAMNGTLGVIDFVVVLILCISVGALMYLIYLQRSDEFGILTAIGYRKSFIFGLICREVISLDILCWVVGLAASWGCVQLMNVFIYLPQGIQLNFLNLGVFKSTIIIPVMVAVFSIFPILFKLRRQDPITTIERRD